MTSEKKYLKKAVKNFLVLFLASIPIVWLALTQVNFSGDLTRIGKLSEDDFGWQLEQKKIPENLLVQYPINEADTLIIGDSFSIPLIWQTALVENNLKPVTYHWNSIGPICDNLGEVIMNSGFKGKKLFFKLLNLAQKKKLKNLLTA